MDCHECKQAIGERKAYVSAGGHVYHPSCAHTPDYDRGYRAGLETARSIAIGYAQSGSGVACDIAEDIRALAPATKEEPEVNDEACIDCDHLEAVHIDGKCNGRGRVYDDVPCDCKGYVHPKDDPEVNYHCEACNANLNDWEAQRHECPPKRAAVSYIERDDGRILCVWNKRYGGWSMPGGLVENGETPEVAQRRELKEETGLDTFAIWPMHEGPATQLPAGANRASIVHVFRVLAKGEPREMEIGCAVTWLTRDEFLKWSPFRDIYAPIFARTP